MKKNALENFQITEVFKRPDGKYNVKIRMTAKESALFHQACNRISELLNRPVSSDEAIAYILDNYIAAHPELKFH